MENKLAENIRDYRKRMGLTQEQLAERLGITLGTVSKWERGSSEPDLSYIMDLADLFRVSVDMMIGFSMRGGDAEAEADRIEAIVRSGEAEKAVREYDNALMKFPNHFRIVSGAAECRMQIGVVYRREEEVKRAVELFRHAIELLPQNRDPRINEVYLRNEIAQCYHTLKDYRKAIEEYRKNNLCGNNDAKIGNILICNEKKPEEGIQYTVRAFGNQISEALTIMGAYTSYYKQTKDTERGIRAVEWILAYLKSLKFDPDARCYFDKMISLVYLVLAMMQDAGGQAEEAERNMNEAVRIAAAFDRDPVFTMENIIFTEKGEESMIYDNTGATAIEGLQRTMEDDEGVAVSADFRRKFDKALETVQQ